MMYPKLAFDNICKNRRTYFPYILTCIFTVAMYYIMKSLSVNEGLNNVFGAATTAYILQLGCNVIAVFSFIFLFYTNSFLTKNRKKEFGLFNILGMEKKHIAKIIAYESIYSAVISLVGGLGFGILLDKLMYVIVARVINTEIPLGFYISVNAVKAVLIVFGILFFLIFLNSLRLIHLSKPIELLRGGNTGEKEPKAKWLIALLGIACLCTGYGISLTIKNPIMALLYFFAAVIFVIIGTYLLFTAVSIVFLKILKMNKRYYYKINHFISVSGMMYRMKQNAVGLANICVLSTMVLVMVSSTASLMVGVEDIIKERYPYQFELDVINGGRNELSELAAAAEKIADDENVTIKKSLKYSNIQFEGILDGDTFKFPDATLDFRQIDNVHNIYAVTADEFSAYTGIPAELEDNEVVLWQNGEKYSNDHIYLFDEKYTITKRTKEFIGNADVNNLICPTFGIVVNDYSIIENLYKEQEKVYGKNASDIKHIYKFDTDLDDEKQKEFSNTIEKKINNEDFEMNVRTKERDSIYELFGGLFFLGIFLGLLFTIAAVLIIYYKQISEGLDDKKRFEIMQKVGMNEHEVKSSIRSQVLTVFFMPLILSGIHTAFAFPILRKILAMFNLTNVRLFAVSTICVFLSFAAIYAFIYLMTAKSYYKIVKK